VSCAVEEGKFDTMMGTRTRLLHARPQSALQQRILCARVAAVCRTHRPTPRLYSGEAASSPKEAEPSAESVRQKTEIKDRVDVEGKDGASEKQQHSKEMAEIKDRYLRSVADFRNLQERTRREVEGARTFAIQRFARDLLESLDNLDRAIGLVPTDEANTEPVPRKDLTTISSGLRMTESILMSTLAKHGLEKSNPMGEPFDPNKHEATFEVAKEDEKAGTIFQVQQTGYTLHGRVLRAAKVGVVKAPAKE